MKNEREIAPVGVECDATAKRDASAPAFFRVQAYGTVSGSVISATFCYVTAWRPEVKRLDDLRNLRLLAILVSVKDTYGVFLGVMAIAPLVLALLALSILTHPFVVLGLLIGVQGLFWREWDQHRRGTKKRLKYRGAYKRPYERPDVFYS